ncbi:MAG: helix-turn-helix transcriptional regulator [Flavobacteriaceae bacterium]|nr:helix-turn-helix transcriptional regulator [Flavobacteriaceae bacterium]MDZ4146816.1 helix-turn-helix transcriptional regulator [Flavobacteriaceae bacterium]
MFDSETDLKGTFLNRVGSNVKKLREVAVLFQFELAVEAGIPKNQVGRIERGEINTSIFVLKKIADALKI